MRRGWATAVLGLLVPALQALHAGGPSPTVDPAARLPEGDSAREYWDVVALLDSGHHFYARFLITNDGPGERNAIAMGDLVDPDGRAAPFENGRRKGRWTLGKDGRSLRIGSSRLDLSGPAARVEIDNDKRGFEVILRFEPDTTSAAVFDIDGYHMDLLQLASKVTGHVQHAEMQEPLTVTGRATLSHTWTSRPEKDVVTARIDVSSLSPGPATFLSFWLPPAAPTRAWMGVRDAGGSTHSVPARRAHIDFQRGEKSEYPVPILLRFDGTGLRATASPGGTPLRRNPLDPLPSAIRMLYSFGARPMRAWVDSSVKVEAEASGDTKPTHWEASGVTTLNFENVFPRPTPDS